MKHITNFEQYKDTYYLIENIRRGQAEAQVALEVRNTGKRYVKEYTGKDLLLDDKTTACICPNKTVLASAQRIMETADGMLHKLRRELCFYNSAVLGQAVPKKYMDKDLPRDLNTVNDSVIEMPRIDLTDKEISRMLDDIAAVEFWFVTAGEILAECFAEHAGTAKT